MSFAEQMARRAATQEEKEIDLTPMLDVVFIMLIFFIVTSSFVKEPGVELEKPTPKTGELIDQGTIIFAVDEKGDIHYNKEKVPLYRVLTLAEMARGEAPKANIVIQVDQDSPSYVIEELMDTVKPLLSAPIGISTDNEA